MNLSSVQPSVNVEYAPHTVNSLDKGTRIDMLGNTLDLEYSSYLMDTFILAFAGAATALVLAGLVAGFVLVVAEYTKS